MTAGADTEPDVVPGVSELRTSRFVAAVFGYGALFFFFIGMALLLAAYGGVAWPDTFAGGILSEHLSYGRAMPMALNALVFGWLTFGLFAGLFHFVPRIIGAPLALPAVARATPLLMAAGVVSGVGAIGAGHGDGGRLLEMPWYSDAVLTLAFLSAAVVLSATVARSGAERSGVALWYAVAAPWWLFLSYATGAIPGLAGAPAELQSAFSSSAVFGMWLASAGVGCGYALVAQMVPDAEFHPRLGRIGFWSLGLLWAWTTARTLQYGPTADWMETIPVLFSAGLVVACLTIVTDFALALRNRFDVVLEATSLRLFALGSILFLVAPGNMFVQSLRSASSVVRFTAWEQAFDLVAVVGAFGLWSAAVVGHVLAPDRPRRFGGAVAGWAMFIGVLFAAGTRWIAGIQQGYTWLGGVESGTHTNFGDGFSNTVAPLHGTDLLTFLGVGIVAGGGLVLALGLSKGAGLSRFAFSGPGIALAAVVMALAGIPALVERVTDSISLDPLYLVVGLGGVMLVAAGLVALAARPSADVGELSDYAWPDEMEPLRARRGAAVVFAVVVVLAFVFPALDARTEPSRLAEQSRNLAEGSSEARGLELYVAEGCWYCHTQQVRAIVTDLGLGPVSTTGDYVFDPAGTFGVARIGPDLAHAGSRPPTDDASWVADHLADPRAERSWSTMPSYRHLSDTDLTALAAYVAGLE